MRRLRELRGFPAFVRSFPFYAKADNIASSFPEMLRTVPGGTTRNPRIAAKDIPAPMAEMGPVRKAGTVPKGPARPPGGAAGGGLGAALLAQRRAAQQRFEALFESVSYTHLTLPTILRV